MLFKLSETAYNDAILYVTFSLAAMVMRSYDWRGLSLLVSTFIRVLALAHSECTHVYFIYLDIFLPYTI